MTDLITIGLNKNKKSFKPTMGKKKRNRSQTPPSTSSQDTIESENKNKKTMGKRKRDQTLATPQNTSDSESTTSSDDTHKTKKKKTLTEKTRAVADIPEAVAETPKTAVATPKAAVATPKATPKAASEAAPKVIPEAIPVVIPEAIPVVIPEAAPKTATTVTSVPKNHSGEHSKDPYTTIVGQDLRPYTYYLEMAQRKLNGPRRKDFKDGTLPTAVQRRTKLLSTTEVVDGEYKSRKGSKWTLLETQTFYDGLKEFGTDFLKISETIPGRSQKEVKQKYKKEERLYPDKVSSYLL